MISIERIKRYGNLQQEASEHTEHPLPPNWPQDGAVTFDNVSLTYTKELKALKGVSFKICACEKVCQFDTLKSPK